MNEESVSRIPWILASINSWFTPTVLFVFLNVIICTIAVISGLGSQNHPNRNKQQQNQQQDQLNNNIEDSSIQQQERDHQQNNEELKRSPSVLERLKSINFYTYSYRSQESISIHTSEDNTHKLDFQSNESEEEIIEDFKQPAHEENEKQEEKSMEEVYGQLRGSHNRTKSDTKPYSGELPVKLPKKMRKSASVKSAFSHFEDGDFVEIRRPATVREGKANVTDYVGDDDDDDVEVDAKADDFINKFKQQLKLQRLDSIVRYKEMLNRGLKSGE